MLVQTVGAMGKGFRVSHYDLELQRFIAVDKDGNKREPEQPVLVRWEELFTSDYADDRLMLSYTIPNDTPLYCRKSAIGDVKQRIGEPVLQFLHFEFDNHRHARWSQIERETQVSASELQNDFMVDAFKNSALMREAAVLYPSRAGIHVVWVLGTPVPLTMADSFIQAFRNDLLNEIASLLTKHEMTLDETQWSRAQRLPNVMRDGKRQPGPIYLALDKRTHYQPEPSRIRELVIPDHITPDDASAFWNSLTGEQQNNARVKARTYLAKVDFYTTGVGEGSRQNSAYKLACMVGRGFALPCAETYAIMQEWNQRNQPPLDEGELQQALESAYLYGTEPYGGKSLRPERYLVHWATFLNSASSTQNSTGQAADLLKLVEKTEPDFRDSNPRYGGWLAFKLRLQDHFSGQRLDWSWLRHMQAKPDSVRGEDVVPGGPTSDRSNIILILKKDPRWLATDGNSKLRMNLASREIVYAETPPFDDMYSASPEMGHGSVFTESDTYRIGEWLRTHYEFRAKDDDVNIAVRMVGESFGFHPIRDYLRSLHGKWDGVDRITRFFPDYLETKSNPVTHGIGRRFLLASVGRAFQPGAFLQELVILISAEGDYGKSTAFKKLAKPEWVTDTPLDLRNKRGDAVAQIMGKWFAELPEMDPQAMGKARSDMKAFASSNYDDVRFPYEKRPVRIWRSVILFGTTNNIAIIPDDGGSRRYVPVEVLRPINLDRIEKDRDQIWAQAVFEYYEALEMFGEDKVWKAWHPSTEIREDLAKARRQFTVTAPLTPVLSNLLFSPRLIHRDRLSIPEIFELLGNEKSRVTAKDSISITEAMRAIRGWTLLSWEDEHGTPVTGYVRDTHVHSEPAPTDRPNTSRP